MAVVINNEALRIERLETAPFGTNAYILICRKSRESVLIDAPGDTDRIINGLAQTTPQHIIITHNHFDHTGALSELKSKLGTPIACHQADAKGLPEKPDRLLNDGNTITLGELELEVLHTPGHTPGSICLFVRTYLISGDTIFPGGPGKTGSPASFKQIIQSITTKILPLPDETQIYPGHGDSTILANEKRGFQAFNSRSHAPNLSGDVLWLSS